MKPFIVVTLLASAAYAQCVFEPSAKWIPVTPTGVVVNRATDITPCALPSNSETTVFTIYTQAPNIRIALDLSSLVVYRNGHAQTRSPRNFDFGDYTVKASLRPDGGTEVLITFRYPVQSYEWIRLDVSYVTFDVWPGTPHID